MNDPEVMERIMEALEKIAYYIEVQVGRQWVLFANVLHWKNATCINMHNLVQNAECITQGIAFEMGVKMSHVVAMGVCL